MTTTTPVAGVFCPVCHDTGEVEMMTPTSIGPRIEFLPCDQCATGHALEAFLRQRTEAFWLTVPRPDSPAPEDRNNER